jgi:hypothetical protein
MRWSDDSASERLAATMTEARGLLRELHEAEQSLKQTTRRAVEAQRHLEMVATTAFQVGRKTIQDKAVEALVNTVKGQEAEVREYALGRVAELLSTVEDVVIEIIDAHVERLVELETRADVLMRARLTQPLASTVLPNGRRP